MNRYDLMRESSIKDDLSDEVYPDPLSYNYNDFEQSSEVKVYKFVQKDLMKFWFFTYLNVPQNPEGDLFLNLNSIPWLGSLEEDDLVIIPSGDDMNKMLSIKRADY